MVQSPPAQKELYPCPACGFFIFAEPPGSYEICSICGWEDCAVQLRYPTAGTGPNAALVVEQQSVLEELPLSVREYAGHHRDPDWRPLNEDEIAQAASGPKSGLDYFHAVSEDDVEENWYYWRKQLSPAGKQ
jgi:hypothetical protein